MEAKRKSIGRRRIKKKQKETKEDMEEEEGDKGERKDRCASKSKILRRLV